MLTNFLEFACGGIESNGNGKRFCRINERGQLLLNKSPLSIGKSPVFFFSSKNGFRVVFYIRCDILGLSRTKMLEHEHASRSI